jgi:hypothetical protein
VTDEQRSSRPIFNATLRAAASWLFFRVATYKGRLASEAMLPVTGNAIGDTWMIGDTPWLYLVTPGTSAAQWVDP